MKVFFYLFLIFFSLSAHAVQYKAQYEAKGMGMTLLSADMTIDLNKKTYQVKTQSKARGILALFIHAQSIFETSGLFHQQNLVIDKSIMINKDKEETEITVNDFADKKDYIDYQSVLISLIRQKTPKTHTLYISDGKRDMKMTLIYDGQKDISKLTGNKTHKLTDAYSVRIKVVSGKKKGWFFKRIQEESTSPLKLYFKYDEKIKMPVLVMGSFNTGIIGTLYIRQKELLYDKTES